MKKNSILIECLLVVFVLAFMAAPAPLEASNGLPSGYATVRDWDKAHEAFGYSSGGATTTGGDFFIADRGADSVIHVFESPGIIDMGAIPLSAVTEAPATVYQDVVRPIEGHSYVTRSQGKYGKFYIHDIMLAGEYAHITVTQYEIEWAYQPNGTRTFGSGASPPPPPPSGCNWTGTWDTYDVPGQGGKYLDTLYFQQVGNQVTATYKNHTYRKIIGNVSGNTLTGTWGDSPPYNQGIVEITISVDCNSITGRWRWPSSAGWEGTWVGKRQGTVSPPPPPTVQPPSGTAGATHLSCENKDNEEKACCCFLGAHTYRFGLQYVSKVVARFDTGRKLDCRSTVELQVDRGTGWQTVKTVQAVSSSGSSEIAPIQVEVPVNDTISSFRISDSCVCCIDFSEITIYGDGVTPPPPPPPTGKLREKYNTGDDYGGDVRWYYWHAQTFTAESSHSVCLVKLKIYRLNNPGQLIVSIRATDYNGHPTGPDLAVGTTDGNTLTTNESGEWREITFPTPYNLVGGTKYAIVVRAPSGGGGNVVKWLHDAEGTYAGGNREASGDSGNTWQSTLSADYMFEVYACEAEPPHIPPTTGTALVAESRTVPPGGTIQVPVRLDNASNVGSMNFVLTYDSKVLRVTKVDRGSLLSGIMFAPNYQQPPVIRFGFAAPNGVSGSGSLAYIEFQAIGGEGSTSPLTLSEVLCKDTSGQTTSPSTQNGTVTIGKKTQPGDYNGDGKVTEVDALAALKMSVGLLKTDLILDIDKDGKITAEDARLILKQAITGGWK